MQAELENGFDKDKFIADLQAKLLAIDEKTSEPLLQTPPLVEPPSTTPSDDPLSLPPAPIQPPTDQRTSADKSLTQIKKFFEDRDRSPEISEPMIIATDSESDDENEKSDLQFIPNQSNLSRNEKDKQRYRAKAKEKSKALMRLALERSERWKCSTCSSFFTTNEALRQHISTDHKDRKICRRCPFTCAKRFSGDVKKHERGHARADVEFKNQTKGRECEICHVWFGNGRLKAHLFQYHLPNDSK